MYIYQKMALDGRTKTRNIGPTNLDILEKQAIYVFFFFFNYDIINKNSKNMNAISGIGIQKSLVPPQRPMPAHPQCSYHSQLNIKY